MEQQVAQKTELEFKRLCQRHANFHSRAASRVTFNIFERSLMVFGIVPGYVKHEQCRKEFHVEASKRYLKVSDQKARDALDDVVLTAMQSGRYCSFTWPQ